MQDDEFLAIIEQMTAIHKQRATLYGSNADPLGNFGEAERVGISPSLSCWLRLTDKYSRITNLFRLDNGPSMIVGLDESREDNLLDLANYAILTLILLRRENEKRASQKGEPNAVCPTFDGPSKEVGLASLGSAETGRCEMPNRGIAGGYSASFSYRPNDL